MATNEFNCVGRSGDSASDLSDFDDSEYVTVDHWTVHAHELPIHLQVLALSSSYPPSPISLLCFSFLCSSLLSSPLLPPSITFYHLHSPWCVAAHHLCLSLVIGAYESEYHTSQMLVYHDMICLIIVPFFISFFLQDVLLFTFPRWKCKSAGPISILRITDQFIHHISNPFHLFYFLRYM